MTSNTPSPIILKHGGHEAGSGEYCFNEAIALAAGEPHTDMPDCASPVIRQFGMTLNDRLDDEQRQLLRPFVLRSIGTAGDGRDPERRQMCAEWLAENLPALFDKAGLTQHAEELRAALASGTVAEENVRRILWNAREASWPIRSGYYSRIREAVQAELRKHDLTQLSNDDIAVAAVVAAAEAEAEAVAEAAAEVAVAVEVAAAAAAAAAVAVEAAAPAAAAAAAAAEAEAAAAAEAEAVAAFGSSRYWAIRDAVYERVYNAMREKCRELLDPDLELLPSGLKLFDRMLPPEPIQPPAIKNAEVLFAVEGGEGSA